MVRCLNTDVAVQHDLDARVVTLQGAKIAKRIACLPILCIQAPSGCACKILRQHGRATDCQPGGAALSVLYGASAEWVGAQVDTQRIRHAR